MKQNRKSSEFRYDAQMPLDAGLLLGPYKIVAFLGAGGMGEVYQARDTRLERTVAVKILHKHVASDPDRRKRFEREARIASQLNHPNVCALYDVGHDHGLDFIVMEFVEGETLAERIRKGPLPLQTTLTLFQQIAEALECAHKQGTLHRDLKPANIKLTPAGKAKVLDFGLAKTFTSNETNDPSERATASLAATKSGVFLGTIGYMSPEQARASPVDQATDIWAFGCCLYEALAGKPAFISETFSDTIAAVLNREPDWNALPLKTPGAVRRLLRQCLEKNGINRPHTATQIREEIARCRAGIPTAGDFVAALGRLRIWRPLAVFSMFVAAFIGYRRWSDETVPRFGNLIQVSSAIGVEDYPTWAPDGATLAYGSIESGNSDIWISQPGGSAAVNRTRDHTGDDRYPSWSPDGRQIAFWSDREGGGYYLMPASSGAASRFASTPTTNWVFHSPPAWSADATEIAYIVYESIGARSEASIEITSILTKATRRIPLPGGEEARLDLSWSRDGRYFAYTESAGQLGEVARVVVFSVADGTSAPLTDVRSLARTPRWSASGDYLYYVSNQGGTADLWRHKMSNGKPVGANQRITTAAQIMQVAFSPDAKRLAFSKGRWVANLWRIPIREDRPATWADAEQLTFEQAFIEYVDVSADGKQIAFSSDRSGNQDLWTMSIAGENLTQLTFDLAPDWSPGWSPDARQIAFFSFRTGDREIFSMPASPGPATQLTHNNGLDAHAAWSPDGREIAIRSERTGNSKIWLIPAGGGAGRQLTFTADYECCPAWSPDSRWVIFSSLHAQGNRLLRIPTTGGEPEQLSSSSTGFAKLWSRDGKIIYFDGAAEKAGNLWTLSLADRSERPVTNLSGRRGTLGMQALASDGNNLYFTWRDDLGDIWTMDVVAE
jgi:Tol biopolymer transport system component/predicted Ser/Thr protein kinase